MLNTSHHQKNVGHKKQHVSIENTSVLEKQLLGKYLETYAVTRYILSYAAVNVFSQKKNDTQIIETKYIIR